MRLHRFYYQFSPSDKKLIIKDKELIHQLRNVLRVQKGQEINFFNESIEKKGVVSFVSKDILEVILKEEINGFKEPEIFVSLFASLLKRENFEFLVEKATEIGVKEIYPLICKRTVKLNFKEERIKRIIKEASEQCGRKSLPIIYSPLKFEEAIELSKNKPTFFFDLKGKEIKELLKEFSEKPKEVNLFIGPEGGWEDQEKKLAEKNNFLIVKISDLVFRSETAGIIGSYLLTHFFNFLS